MFRKFSKTVPAFFAYHRSILFFAMANLLFSTNFYAVIIQVTDTDGGVSGSLNIALQQAQDGDIIDCSPIAGQTIYLTSHLPAIGFSLTASTPTVTILGSGVTIDASGSTVPAFSLAQGSATISDFTIQNTVSKGGNGGSGKTGGGGGTGGGGALYVHSGSTMTISTMNLNNNQAVGGAGGTGSSTGGSGGGGGGFGGGTGGNGQRSGVAGSGGGGGGNNGGTSGGAGAGSPNSFSNFAGAGGGGEIPGPSGASFGGSAAASDYSPAHSGGAGGIGTISDGAGGGGGAGSGGNGFTGSNSINNSGNGIGGAGGYGFGVDNTYGAGGAGGGGYGGGAGRGTSGGGGGYTGPGGIGGIFGGGGGASNSTSGTGGNGGFGAGGGGGHIGGIDTYGVGGSGGSSTGTPAGGGGGSGLGGAIFIQTGGALIMQDSVSLSDNSTTAGSGGIATGGSNGENGSSLGQDIFIQSGGTVTFQINNDLTISTPIEGAGLLSQVTGPGITKSGTGTINLSGANTYLGDTLIQSGTLKLNGSVSGDVRINSGGTLSGNGTANGNIYNNGTISPGNSIGTASTTNLYTYPTSVYNVEVNSASDSDLIIASGFAEIDGSVVVSPDDTNFTTPLTYTIITTSTGITGEFSSLTSTTPSLMSLIYNPLTIQLNYLPVKAIDLTGNALNAANAFATLPALPGSDTATVNNALLGLNFDDMQDAFNQMSPALFSGPTEVQLLDAILIRTTYTKHLQKNCLKEDFCCQQPISIWIDGFAQWQNQKNSFGYKDTTFGATIGLDYCIHDWSLGAAFSSTYDDFHWKDFGGTANINSYYGGLYGRWNHDALYLNIALIGAFNQYKTMRQIIFTEINRRADSQHNGNEWLAHVGLGYWMDQSRFQWTPYVNLDYVVEHENNYTETGADSLDLQVNAKNSMLFQGEAGISLSTTYQTYNGEFIPMLTLGYINQTPCSSKNYYASFVNSSDVFVGTGGNYERNLFVPRLTCMYQGFCDRVNISIYYDAQVGSQYWAQDVGFDLTIRF